MAARPPGPGTTIVRERTFRQADFDLFARLSGDDNPIHVDPAFAARTRFGRPVAHGMLLYAALRGLMEEAFPGARQAEQSLMFPAPTFADEPMRLEIEVEKAAADGTVLLAMRVRRLADDTLTLEGRAALLRRQGA